MFTTVFEAMGTRHAILSRFALLTYLPPILYLLPDAVEAVCSYAYEKKGKIGKIASAAAAAVFSVACYTILMVNNYNGAVPYVSQFNRPYDIFVVTKSTEEDFYDDGEDIDEEEEEDDDFYDDEDSENNVIDVLPEFQ